MREMPIGIQSFAEIVNNNLAYVDKTALIHKLAQSRSPLFLARPRRFGKSLLISTLDAYFSGKRELFEGLALAKLEQEWEEYPVIRIDLSGANYMTEDDINDALSARLKNYEETYGVTDIEANAALRLNELIRTAANAAGKGVVVLIDEYDKPLLESLDNAELNGYYRNILRAFYGVLKGAGEHLRFVLLTGVTKFSQVSVFSDLNNLRDISMEDGYADICGITQEELEDVFAPEIAALAEKEGVTHEEILARMKQLYDGYHFSKNCPDVYNPFSVLNTLAKQEFGMYWFKTGTPTFLIKLIEQSGFDVLEFQGTIKTSASAIDDFRIGQTNPVPVLYQSGYLTIKGTADMGRTLLLGFPNEEVESGFLESLLPMFAGDAAYGGDFDAFRFKDDLAEGDTEAFLTRLKSLYASVPYSQKPRDEHYYQSIFYVVFTLMGQFVRVEEHTHKGRSDAVVETADAVYVFEFKLVSGGSQSAAEAMRQIDEGGYAEKYAASSKHLCKVAVIFNMENRNISEWLVG